MDTYVRHRWQAELGRANRPLLDEKEWKRSVRRLSGKKGVDAQLVELDLEQQFKDAFGARLEFEPDFLVEAVRPKKGKPLRDSMIELAEILNRLPIEATRDNPSFQTLLIGSNVPGVYGDFYPSRRRIRITMSAFQSPPRLALTKSSNAAETLTHELGHAVHQANWRRFESWIEALWDLPPERAGADVWRLDLYKSLPGTPKDLDGITAYGSTDPLEDFADTFEILYVEEGRRLFSVRAMSQREDGRLIKGEPHYRFSLLKSILEELGWEVPKL